jgi:hypothetical protein
MNSEEIVSIEQALFVLDVMLKDQKLNALQELVFCQSWQGRTYPKIAEDTNYDPEHIKFVGFRLWHLLSETFGEKVRKNNIKSVIRRRYSTIK